MNASSQMYAQTKAFACTAAAISEQVDLVKLQKMGSSMKDECTLLAQWSAEQCLGDHRSACQVLHFCIDADLRLSANVHTVYPWLKQPHLADLTELSLDAPPPSP